MQILSGATSKPNNACDGDFQFHHFWKEKTCLLEKALLTCWIQAPLSMIKYDIKVFQTEQTGLQKENQMDCFQPVIFFLANFTSKNVQEEPYRLQKTLAF